MNQLFTNIKNVLITFENFLYNYVGELSETFNFSDESSKSMPNINIPEYVPDLDRIGEVPIDSKDVSIIHQMNQNCKFSINIPGHLPRTDSKLFETTRKHLIDELDTPCWICGSKENRQVHHFILEMSLQNAVDISKLKKAYPNFPNWDKIIDGDTSTYFNITDSEFNMLILCQSHHTGTNKNGKGYGIHYAPYNIWLFQKFVKDDFKFIN